MKSLFFSGENHGNRTFDSSVASASALFGSEAEKEAEKEAPRAAAFVGEVPDVPGRHGTLGTLW